jgi:hypothetical protein
VGWLAATARAALPQMLYGDRCCNRAECELVGNAFSPSAQSARRDQGHAQRREGAEKIIK